MAPSQKHKKRGSTMGCLVKIIAVAVLTYSCYTVYSQTASLPHPSGRAPTSAAAATAGSSVQVDPGVMELIRIQNETIVALREQLEASLAARAALAARALGHGGGGGGGGGVGGGGGGVEVSTEALAQVYAQLERTQAEVVSLRAAAAVTGGGGIMPAQQQAWANGSAGSIGYRLPRLLRSDFDADCEARFGLGLSDRWRAKQQEWCASPSGSGGGPGQQSSIRCYPHTQEHKKGSPKRSGPDMFCEGTNVFVDFSKVSGRHSSSKPPLGSQYLTFGNGATFATCAKTAQWRDSGFMPHASRQLAGRGFRDRASLPAPGTFTVAKGATYLLARDEVRRGGELRLLSLSSCVRVCVGCDGGGELEVLG